MKEIFGTKKSIFLETTPGAYFFKGIQFCADTSGVATFICKMMEKRESKSLEPLPNGAIKFSFFNIVSTKNISWKPKLGIDQFLHILGIFSAKTVDRISEIYTSSYCENCEIEDFSNPVCCAVKGCTFQKGSFRRIELIFGLMTCRLWNVGLRNKGIFIFEVKVGVGGKSSQNVRNYMFPQLLNIEENKTMFWLDIFDD